jgi:serine/threonine protein kinase
MIDLKADAKAVFLQALDCTAVDELIRFLDQACGADAVLRSRVEELLRAHRDAGCFLGGADMLTAPLDQPVRERPGTVIGPYKLLEPIGEGGFGVVFLAEQQHPVRRKVALKVLKPGMDTKQVVARFEAERQALALMDHPNIARVFDGGVTDTGRPFFVMELVKGVPITTYCDERRLTPRQRLDLFVPVCQAVQHAHQKGIIHRDLKPSNVLVAPYDGTPVVKVIDFGVAKAAGQPLTDRTLYTGLGAVVGTLEYMSPEQAELNNLDVDTRSDVYSLGVLLYELLTGTTPLSKERIRALALLEGLRLVREEDPPPPSVRLSTNEELPAIAARRGLEPRKLSGLVCGELDWVVMKALEKDRSRRYETATGLAADVQRYLADEPVQACPPSAAYRFRKFARRNRRALAAAGLAGAALILAVVGLMISNRRIDHERSQTEQANARLNANLWLAMETLDEVYLKVGEWSPKDPERAKEYHDLFGKMLGFYKQFAAQYGSDPQVRANLAAYHLQFGNLLLAGGERAKAAEHYRRSLALQTQVVADSPGVAAHRDRLAFAHMHLADLLTLSGQAEEAAEHYDQGFRIVDDQVTEGSGRPYGGRGPGVAAYYRCLAWNRATCLDPRFLDPARAVEAGLKAAELFPLDYRAWALVGIAHYRAGDWAAAVAAFDNAMKRGGGVSTDWLFLAMAHWKRGDKEQARRWYDRAVRGAPSGPSGFPLRYDGFRAEAAALFGADREARAQDPAGAPAKR